MSDDRLRLDHKYKEDFPPDQRIQIQYRQVLFVRAIWPLICVALACVSYVLIFLSLSSDPGRPAPVVRDFIILAFLVVGPAFILYFVGLGILAVILRYYQSVYPWLHES